MDQYEIMARVLTSEDEPVCFRCGRPASDLAEYRAHAAANGTDPGHEARKDGTFNRRTNRFACTDCYLAIGMPTAPTGWTAP